MTASADVSYDPRTGRTNGEVPASSDDEVAAVVAAAAACAAEVAATPPTERARWVGAIADALEAASGELVDLADAETALGRASSGGRGRPSGRTAALLRRRRGRGLVPRRHDRSRRRAPTRCSPASTCRSGRSRCSARATSRSRSACSATTPPPRSLPGARSSSRHTPRTRCSAAASAELATEALRAAGAPDGTFGIVHGFEAGVRLVEAPQITAVAFTGSQRAGMALWRRGRAPSGADPGVRRDGHREPRRGHPAPQPGPPDRDRRRIRRLVHARRRAVLHQARPAARPARRAAPRTRSRRRCATRPHRAGLLTEGHRRRRRVRGIERARRRRRRGRRAGRRPGRRLVGRRPPSCPCRSTPCSPEADCSRSASDRSHSSPSTRTPKPSPVRSRRCRARSPRP